MPLIEVVKDGKVILSGREEPEDEFIINIDDLDRWDWTQETVEELLRLGLEGPTTARLIYLCVRNFLDTHGEIYVLSSEELREANR